MLAMHNALPCGAEESGFDSCSNCNVDWFFFLYAESHVKLDVELDDRVAWVPHSSCIILPKKTRDLRLIYCRSTLYM